MTLSCKSIKIINIKRRIFTITQLLLSLCASHLRTYTANLTSCRLPVTRSPVSAVCAGRKNKPVDVSQLVQNPDWELPDLAELFNEDLWENPEWVGLVFLLELDWTPHTHARTHSEWRVG